jgi:nicotinamide mononucleotide transporter
MHAVWQNIREGLIGASWLDQANLVLGIIGVVLMIRRNLWAFPVGLLAVTVQGILFYQYRFYADAALQVCFFGALAYGWYYWLHGKGDAPELPVTRLSWAARGALIALGVFATMAWAFLLARHTDAVMPVRDAFIAAFSLLAQGLQARKKLDNWPVWLAVNAVAVATYWAAGLHYTAFLYAVYFGLAVAGWRAWAQAGGKGRP